MKTKVKAKEEKSYPRYNSIRLGRKLSLIPYTAPLYEPDKLARWEVDKVRVWLSYDWVIEEYLKNGLEGYGRERGRGVWKVRYILNDKNDFYVYLHNMRLGRVKTKYNEEFDCWEGYVK